MSNLVDIEPRFAKFLDFTSHMVQALQALEARTDKQQYNFNEAIELIFEINTLKRTQNLNFPIETESYKVISQSSSSQMQIINGKASSKKQIILTLIPKKTGSITLPSAEIIAGKVRYRSQPITINVSKYSDTFRSGSQNLTQRQKQEDIELGKIARANRKLVFARLELSKKQVYLNEQLMLKLKVYHKKNLKNLSVPEIELDNFISQRLHADTNQNKEFETTYAGEKYSVYEIDYLLYPQREGRLTIPETNIDIVAVFNHGADLFGRYSSLFSYGVEEERSLKTNSASLQVNALPELTEQLTEDKELAKIIQNQDLEFSGFVGSQLNLRHDIKDFNYNKPEVKNTQALNIISRFQGLGNPNLIENKNLIVQSDEYQIYEDKESLEEIEANSKVSFVKTFENAVIIDSSSQKIKLKTKPFLYFSTTKNKYLTLAAKEFDLIVSSDLKEKITSLQNNSKLKVKTKKGLLWVNANQIYSYSSKANIYFYIILILAMLNLLAIYSVFRSRLLLTLKKFKSHSLKKVVNIANFDINLKIKQIKNSSELVEISKFVKDAYLQAGQQHELEATKLEGKYLEFIRTTDLINFGKQQNSESQLNSSSEQVSQALKEQALEILKELKEYV